MSSRSSRSNFSTLARPTTFFVCCLGAHDRSRKLRSDDSRGAGFAEEWRELFLLLEVIDSAMLLERLALQRRRD